MNSTSPAGTRTGRPGTNLPSLALSACAAGLTCALLLSACTSMDQIDRRVGALMRDTTARMNAAGTEPTIGIVGESEPDLMVQDPNPDPFVEHPVTVNPDAQSLTFSPLPQDQIEQTDVLIERLERYEREPDDVIRLDLQGALAYAIRNSREYRFAEEDYILQALRTLIEQHRWGPRFFNDTTASISAIGNDGLYNSSVSIVNDLRVTQRLPYGGEVSARALARATENLHEFVAGQRNQSADFVLSANLPLLRGAGMTARESLVQSNRNMVYAARDFEVFRRDFLFSITTQFLGLVVQQQSIGNSVRSVERLRAVADLERALYRAGRRTPFQAALAENSYFEQLDRLNGARENFRLAVDRFKVRLGMSINQDVDILPSRLGMPIPDVTLAEAVAIALEARLDLQTRRDQIDDARRGLEIARNNLLPDLNLSGSLSMPTDPDRDRAGLRFSPGDTNFNAAMSFGMPLDRDIERMSLRDSQVRYERTVRSYEQFRDNVIVNVRSAVRSIDRALYSLDIQRENVRIALRRQASIEADPDRATSRDKTEAANQLQAAEDSLDAAIRDLEVAILDYLLQSGQLRVDAAGSIEPLEGMNLSVDFYERLRDIRVDLPGELEELLELRPDQINDPLGPDIVVPDQPQDLDDAAADPGQPNARRVIWLSSSR